MRRCLAVAAPIAIAFASPALAASNAAWEKSMAQATRACLKAADLNNAAIAGTPILFSDNAGKTALLVTGRWRPAHMNNARATMLCLYDRQTRKAETQEAPRWSVAR